MLSPQLSAHSQDRLFPAIDWISHETSSIIRPTDSSSLGRVYVPVFFFFSIIFLLYMQMSCKEWFGTVVWRGP